MGEVNVRSCKTRSFSLTLSKDVSQDETRLGQDAERFWSKVRKADGDACWLWTGSLGTRGYGQFFANGRPQGAHRVAFALSHGSIPKHALILHSCDNPPCCNPAHLSAGDQFDNMRDASGKGRLSVPRPKRQKVTDEQIAEMKALYASGVLRYVIARQFGVSPAFVGLVLSGKRRVYVRPALRRVS